MNDEIRLKVITEAFKIACDWVKKYVIEVPDKEFVDFMNCKFNNTIPAFFLLKAEEKLGIEHPEENQ